MKSRLYTGLLRHRRHQPRVNAFSYRVFMFYLSLDELPGLFDNIPLWSARRRAIGRYRREDFLGDPAQPLDDEVRRRIREETGREHRGPIYLLANLRYFGIQMNPICCYYCYNEDETRLEYLVAEVTNTPWNERHSYVLPAGEGNRLACDFDKAFHVSPFNPMAQRYHWRSNTPGRRLGIHLANSAGGEPVFDATLALTAEPLTAGNLNRMLLRYPFMTAKVAAAIYWEALKLFLKRVPLYPHPEKSKPSGV
ncbi:DUF1365 domain-containing protein [Pseudohaliea rubra]|uniref:Plasmid partition ParA protein n=1 Tax=Pseudohaliea rubra DSM 19751 TaxID=1265313 RepID=A0A095VNX3_9GAMM|nr:DUF1365 domain-containing protein [Pseudohaliea rubra]KGE03142.1 hypothetical protein HRUBRA_02283 [Pseudohaliea rubra DSM 19751]